MASNVQFRNSNGNCCVVNCHNAYYNTDESVKFYSFPGQWYETNRRNIWISRVRRISEQNGKLWKLKPHHKICSAHFVGNKKSNHPLDPSYNPTVFPNVYLKRKQTPRDLDSLITRLQKSTALKSVLGVFTFEGTIKESDAVLNSLTGVMLDRFLLLMSFLTAAHHENLKLNTENRLLLFLMKLKLGISNSALGALFQIHETTVSTIFLLVLNELVQKARNLVSSPRRESIWKTMPKSFQENDSNCRAIIDCLEVRISRPKKVEERVYSYSQYKSHFTAKFLIGMAHSGFVFFVSKYYGGRASDSFIANDCGFLQLLERSDVILGDKGFLGIKKNVGIHVKRAMQRIKIYNILRNVPYNLLPYLHDIVYMCCTLTNLQELIKEDE